MHKAIVVLVVNLLKPLEALHPGVVGIGSIGDNVGR